MELVISVKKELINKESVERLQQYGIIDQSENPALKAASMILDEVLVTNEKNPSQKLAKVYSTDTVEKFDLLKNKIKMICNNEWNEKDEAMFQTKLAQL